MKKSNFTEEQILFSLQQVSAVSHCLWLATVKRSSSASDGPANGSVSNGDSSSGGGALPIAACGR